MFQITLGRKSDHESVDVDLSLEGPACKVSRRQGTIKLRSNGDFFIANEGKRPLFIDGIPLLQGNKSKLNNNCTIEVSGPQKERERKKESIRAEHEFHVKFLTFADCWASCCFHD